MRYNNEAQYVPGKHLVLADFLSKSQLLGKISAEELGEEVEAFVNFIVSSYPVRDTYIAKIIKSLSSDEIYNMLNFYFIDG